MALLIESRPLFSARQGTCHGPALVTCPTALTTQCTWVACSTRMNRKRCSRCQGSCPLTAEVWFMRSFMMKKFYSTESTEFNSVASPQNGFICFVSLDF